MSNKKINLCKFYCCMIVLRTACNVSVDEPLHACDDVTVGCSYSFHGTIRVSLNISPCISHRCKNTAEIIMEMLTIYNSFLFINHLFLALSFLNAFSTMV